MHSSRRRESWGRYPTDEIREALKPVRGLIKELLKAKRFKKVKVKKV